MKYQLVSVFGNRTQIVTRNEKITKVSGGHFSYLRGAKLSKLIDTVRQSRNHQELTLFAQDDENNLHQLNIKPLQEII